VSLLLSLLAFITLPPGSWLHTIGLLVVLEAPVALAFNRWWVGSGRGRRAPPAEGGATRYRAATGRLALAAGSLFVAGEVLAAWERIAQPTIQAERRP